MQYPAVVIPFTTADPELDPIDDAFIPMHELDKQVQELCKSRFTGRLWPWQHGPFTDMTECNQMIRN